MTDGVVGRERELTRLLTALTFLLIFFMLTRTPQDADMWWHLRAGQLMWEQKTILLADPFSYTRAGEPWTNAFWLSEVLFYQIFRFSGFFGVSLFTAMAGAATFTLIFRRLTGNPLLNMAVVLLAAMVAAPIWSPRPQILSFFLLAWLDGRLSRWQRGETRQLWIWVPLFALWANLHGGWIWGILLILAHLFGALIEKALNAEEPPDKGVSLTSAAIWAGISALAIGLNPNGLAIWRLPFHTVDVSLEIQEWLSPDFHRLDFHPLLWMIFLLLIAGNLAKVRPDWPALVKVVGFAYLTFISQRSIATFAIVAAPLLAHWGNYAIRNIAARPVEERPSAGRQLAPVAAAVVNAVIIGALLTVSVIRLYWLSSPAQVERGVPASAVAWIRANRPEGRLLNSYNWGGYLIWALPEYPVFIDGRADLYGSVLIEEWQEIVSGTDRGLATLDSREINLILLEPGWPLLTRLPDRGWKLVYQDNQAVIFVR